MIRPEAPNEYSTARTKAWERGWDEGFVAAKKIFTELLGTSTVQIFGDLEKGLEESASGETVDLGSFVEESGDWISYQDVTANGMYESERFPVAQNYNPYKYEDGVWTEMGSFPFTISSGEVFLYIERVRRIGD